MERALCLHRTANILPDDSRVEWFGTSRSTVGIGEQFLHGIAVGPPYSVPVLGIWCRGGEPISSSLCLRESIKASFLKTQKKGQFKHCAERDFKRAMFACAWGTVQHIGGDFTGRMYSMKRGVNGNADASIWVT